ncbi:hypothetical protein GCM10025867_50840 (plasmid) [Frondihabitans sucicola]|uniref:Uncharacterized protein n=1 Tax=Frondihabitans sucicola TaxID=1268041 RepID=A0ABM8GWP6_9MICO|nr:hypothetical protein [Frondihabitans sucicola]BDZ52843.1 hypothetical protein GCM10025867_50840 [Frondihabitans sucicola]
MIRASGSYALFEGRWYACDHYPLPGREQEALLRDVADLDSDWLPGPGFQPTKQAPETYFRRVDEALIEARMKVATTCIFGKIGPFDIWSVFGYDPVRVLVRYVGDDPSSALALPGFEKSTSYDLMGEGIFGAFDAAAVSDVVEKTEPMPTHYDPTYFAKRDHA